MWRTKYITVDWGTTNRRAWLVDGDGSVIAQFADRKGVISVRAGGFEQAVAEVRQKLGDYPMLLAGMAGSDRGWRQAPYVPCPAGASSLARDILWVDPGYTGIVPGMCQTEGHADVMRGEEVQALGALAGGMVSREAYICHPGTHTKWIRLAGGQIRSFLTMMTGELFSLLQGNSILSPQMETQVTDGDSFQAGLEAAQKGASLLSGLFAVRASHLLGHKPVADASFASGLLIGSDVEEGLSHARPDEKITVVGRSDLCHLYASAIGKVGFESEIIDGDRSFLAGIRSIAQHLQAG